MNNIATLAKMQLKEKLHSQKNGAKHKSASSFIVTVFATLLKFAFSTAVLCGLYIVAMLFSVFGTTSHVPPAFMAFLFSVLLVLSVISCTGRLTKALYFSRDNVILLTLPATPTQVFLSKIAVFLIFELKKNFSFLIPMFVAYFIIHGHSFVFYPWLIVCFILISVLTVALGAFLSIPAAWITNIFRQRRYLQLAATMITVIAVIVGLFLLVSAIPKEIDLRNGWYSFGLKIKDLLNEFSVNFSLLYDLTRMIIGEVVDQDFSILMTFPVGATFLRFGVLVLVTAAFFALGIIIVNPLFYSMASKPFEFLKYSVDPKKNRVRGSKFAAIYTEFLKAFKDSARTTSNIAIALSIPALTFVLNLIFSAMPTTEFGDKLIFGCNVLIILLVTLNSNAYAASIFSRDGRSAYLIKIQPKNPTALLVAKLLPNTVFCAFSLILTGSLLVSFSNFAPTDVFLLMLGIFLVYLAHLFYSAELDIINPHTEIYAAVGEYESDPNERKASSAAFFLSFLISVLLLLFLFKETIISVCLKFTGIALLVFSYRVYLFVSNIKLYYKEK